MKYTFNGQKIIGELASQLDKSRVTGISGTEGVIVYTQNGIYFVQTYDEHKQRVPRDNMNEYLQGLLESRTKEIAMCRTGSFFSDVEVKESKLVEATKSH